MMNGARMRALLVAVVVMGVLILAGVAIIVVTIISRAAAPGATPAQALLDEPAGTRIANIAASPDRVAVQLQGGGADRVAVIDTRTGRVIARIALAH
jgi:flagellar basal body-associated protein FliL